MSHFISSLAYEPGFPPVWEGLDYESAKDATPRLYGVSFGNGNNGVSHTYADYYVRTSDPWTLARVAMLESFKRPFWDAALSAMDVDGEAEYTISAVIYNPEDVDSSEAPEADHSLCDDGEDCEGCEHCERDEDDSYCSANGAWCICEVFPETDPRDSRMIYDSLDAAFSAEGIRLASED